MTGEGWVGDGRAVTKALGLESQPAPEPLEDRAIGISLCGLSVGGKRSTIRRDGSADSLPLLVGRDSPVGTTGESRVGCVPQTLSTLRRGSGVSSVPSPWDKGIPREATGE